MRGFDLYFADNCLRVTGDDHFLKNTSLSCFLKAQPYTSECTLDLSLGPCPELSMCTMLSQEAGVTIGLMHGGHWLLASRNPDTPCLITANADYSIMKGYADTTHCTDNGKLKDNFLLLLKICMETRLAGLGCISVHASCVQYNREAILFIAPSGTGKSTQAKLWSTCFGAQIISGDRPAVKPYAKGTQVFGVPWDGKEQIFLQESCTVKAIVEVRQSQSNHIRKLENPQAFRMMMKQLFIPMWDDSAKFSVMRTMQRMIEAVPVYRLFCLPDESATKLLHNALFLDHTALIGEERNDMRIKEGFILRNIIDEWIVMPSGTNIKQFEAAIVLNELAAFIWKKLEKPISRDDLLTAILDVYDIDAKTAATDMDALLAKLRTKDLLVETAKNDD